MAILRFVVIFLRRKTFKLGPMYDLHYSFTVSRVDFENFMFSSCHMVQQFICLGGGGEWVIAFVDAVMKEFMSLETTL